MRQRLGARGACEATLVYALTADLQYRPADRQREATHGTRLAEEAIIILAAEYEARIRRRLEEVVRRECDATRGALEAAGVKRAIRHILDRDRRTIDTLVALMALRQE